MKLSVIEKGEAYPDPARDPLVGLEIKRVRQDFPILKQQVYGKPLVYLDNAGTAQKPQVVIDKMSRFYEEQNSNIHRGVHCLSQLATKLYEEARIRLQKFINAERGDEVVFIRGATEGINLVMQTYGRQHVGEGDEVLITHMEHHSNIVPWQMLCESTGATLKVAPINERGELIMDEFDKLLTDRTKIVGVVHISNALGTINPVKEITAKAHAVGAAVVVDGAQSVPHMKVDVQDLDCDFFAFSGHKMFGPTGAGVLYGKAKHLKAMPPYQGGGDMILSVSFDKTVYNKPPQKFEAGTPNIAGVIGLGAAAEYITDLGLEKIAAHEADLLEYGTQLLEEIPGVKLMGTARNKASILAFTMDSAHPHDIGQILNEEGVAVRAGHHCAQPVMQHFGVPATARASIAFYNTREELDALAAAIRKVNKVFGG